VSEPLAVGAGSIDDGRSLARAPPGITSTVPSASWTLLAVAENVADVRQAVAEFAQAHGVSEPVLSDVRLAVSEAVTNAVVHGFRGGREPGTVTVSVTIMPDHRRIEVTVIDDGVGILPRRRDSPGLGVGLPVIGRIAHQVDHRAPADGGTELWMCFRFAATEQPRGASDASRESRDSGPSLSDQQDGRGQ
jgi:anti-sigma regulatory factor (Ser/Thr protein kinase)